MSTKYYHYPHLQTLAKDRMEQSEAKLREIEDAAWYAKIDFLQAEAEREWKKIRKKKPHWTKVLFGNGTFVVIGMKDNEDPWKMTGVRDSLSGAISEHRWTGPAYLRYFWWVLEASEGGLDDLTEDKS